MSKYIAEQVSEWLRQRAVGRYIHRTDAELNLMADAIDALLRERELVKAGVTYDMINAAMLAYNVACHSQGDMSNAGYAGMLAALEAVAPRLASARAKQEPYCYTVEQKNGLSQGAMCRTKAECEASPLFDPENDHVIPLYREPVLASARVPESEWITELRGKLLLSKATHVFSFTRNEVMEMLGGLAAAPKPEVSERHHWLCCGALNPDHSDKPRVMPDCFDPERHVWAVSPKPETEE